MKCQDGAMLAIQTDACVGTTLKEEGNEKERSCLLCLGENFVSDQSLHSRQLLFPLTLLFAIESCRSQIFLSS